MTELLERIQLTPGGVVALVVAVFALRAFFRGIARLAFGMVGLAVSAWVGVQVFRNGAVWLRPVLGAEPSADAILYSAWGVGIVCYITLAATGRAFANRLTGDERRSLGPARLTGAALSLVPSLFLVWVAYAALRSSGVVSELQGADRLATAEDGETVELGGLFAGLMRRIDDSGVGRLLAKLDPFAPGETSRLSQVLLLAKDAETWEQVRAVPAVAAVLDHPSVQRLLRDNDVRSLVAHSDYTGLVQRPELAAVAAEPAVANALAAISTSDVAAALSYTAPAGGGSAAVQTNEPTIEGIPASQIPKARVVRARPGRPGTSTGSPR